MRSGERLLIGPFWMLMTVLGSWILLLVMQTTALAQVLLSEILADPASDWNGNGEVHYRDDEWIEVTNYGVQAIDLSAYFVRDALGEEPHLNLSGTLPAGESALFLGSDAVAWQQATGVGSGGLSLNNGGDAVELLVDESGNGDLVRVDSYVYQEHEAEDDRASGRLPDTRLWALFDGLNPYSGIHDPPGTGCFPSPGTPNDCVPLVDIEPRTWGALKAGFR
jgi:hypothetical protein